MKITAQTIALRIPAPIPLLVSPPIKPSGMKIAAMFASLSRIVTPSLVDELNQPGLTMGTDFYSEWSDMPSTMVILATLPWEPSLERYFGIFFDLGSQSCALGLGVSVE